MKRFLPLFLLFVVLSCKTEKEPGNQASTDKKDPADSQQVGVSGFSIRTPDDVYRIDSGREQVLITKKQSRIYLPSGAFETSDGKTVSGEVELIFREYHTTGEIISSKIPMVYTTPQGEKQDFESAGMFEVRARQGEEELQLKKGKEIRVDLVTDNPGSFNFYQMNQQVTNWELKDTKCLPVKNPEIPKLQKSLDSIATQAKKEPKKPALFKNGDELFDIKLDYNDFPELAELNGMMWNITEKDKAKRELIKKHLFSQTYKLLEVENTPSETIEFKLAFIVPDDTITFTAAPALKGKLFDRQKKKYEELVAKIKADVERANQIRKQLEREKQLLRSFNIDELGIYNYDRQFKDPQAVPLAASFQFEGMNGEVPDYVSVFLIPGAKKVVIHYTEETFHNFALNPNENNRLIAILPDNQVYCLKNKEIAEAFRENKSTGSIEFRMKKHGKKIGDSAKLDQLIASL